MGSPSRTRSRFTAAEVKEAPFDLKVIKEVGFSAKDCRDAKFPLAELREVGFSAYECGTHGAKFTCADLKDAEFPLLAIKDAGLLEGKYASRVAAECVW